MPIDPLITDRLLIRELELDDRESILAFAKDPHVMAHLPQGPDTADDASWFIDRAIEDQSEPIRDTWYLGVINKDTGRLIGVCSLSVRSARNLEAELGFRYERAAWGKGFATEAAREIVAFGFSKLGLHRIFGRCSVHNPGSAQVLEKLGMQLEGRLRDCILIRDDWVDHYCYSVLANELNTH